MHQLFHALSQNEGRATVISHATTLIVGIGSSHGDDQFGWRVAGRLQAMIHSPAIIVRTALTPVTLLDWLDDVRRLILCDAVRDDRPAGTVRRLTWPTDRFVQRRHGTTHGLSLPDTLRLAERLGSLPPEVIIWAATGTQYSANCDMSRPIADCIESVAHQIVTLLAPTSQPSRAQPCTNSPS